MGYSLDILNSIRVEGSPDYQARIPEATQATIASIGNALQTYTVLYNEFCEALFNKIGKTILEQKMFNNKLARFKQGTVLNQQDVEEIFMEMAKSEGTYDKNGSNPLGRREGPDIKAIYHRMNRQDVYCVSIGDIDFVRVFRSEATLDSFIKGIINSVYSGASYDEWLAMKKLIANYDGYYQYEVPAIGLGNASGITVSGLGNPQLYAALEGFTKQLIKTVRKAVQDLSFPSTRYNKAGVNTWTNPEDLVFLVNKDVLAEVDVEVLSRAFNMGKTDFQVEVIPIDGLPLSEDMSLTDYYGFLVDKDWFRIYDTLSHFEPQRNAQGLFTNYFYHVHQILSLSSFKNAVVFKATPIDAYEDE